MVYDLLDSAAAVGLQLRENLKNGVYVDGLQEQTVTCAVDAYNVRIDNNCYQRWNVHGSN